MERYEQKKLIGRGNYGSAYLVVDKTTGNEYVMKKILTQGLSDSELQAAQREATLLEELQHPNIIGYYDSFVDGDNLCIVTTYAEGGDLFRKIKETREGGKHFTTEQILSWFIQITMALEYMHKKKTLHRDLKTQNIFLTKADIIKLGDFGIARVLENTDEMATTVAGTPYYMSPEVCESKPYTYKSDIWALGCVLYELCMLKHAFDAKNLLSLVYQIVQGKYPQIPEHYGEEIRGLVNKMLSKNVDERPSASKILESPFIKSRMTKFLEDKHKFLRKGSKTDLRQSMASLRAQTPTTPSTPTQQFSATTSAKLTATDMSSISSSSRAPEDTMTPKERLAMRKREQADEAAKKLEAARRAAADQRRSTKARALQEANSPSPLDWTRKSTQPQLLPSSQLPSTTSSTSTHTPASPAPSPATRQAAPQDTGSESDDYDDDFESDSEDELKHQVISGMQDRLKVTEKSRSSLTTPDTPDERPVFASRGNIVQKLRSECKRNLGSEFDTVYNILKERQEQGTHDDKKLKDVLIETVGKDKYSACLQVDQLIFHEMVSHNG